METALITGGSSGMGLEYARQLARKGANLVIVSNNQEQLDDAADELGPLMCGNAWLRLKWADLSAPGAAKDLHGWCCAEGIRTDILVCNAGMYFFKELVPDDCRRVETMIDLHIRVNTELCILFGNDMKVRKEGRIILVSSMAAKLPVPGISIYSATKAYLLSFGKSMWFEMKPYGVKFTTVCPAAIATPLYNIKPSLMNAGIKTSIIHKPSWLVKKALRASEHGRRVIRPSSMNCWLPAAIALLPAKLESFIWKKIRK